ncbi:DNA recombination protein RmuC [Temperatibacter marinus]|uniref:DNA recombination protein RmuC homolog n=1 Tax=Temperatibacter marinus TaxID=1456591 RepID=A0AA52EDQ1_9PROT|nr:DNA recombination protein RmuC [Temperatibacter marinus]WND02820.1 DNA recombination protein RmuC [Temperatibacter marinus]
MDVISYFSVGLSGLACLLAAFILLKLKHNETHSKAGDTSQVQSLIKLEMRMEELMKGLQYLNKDFREENQKLNKEQRTEVNARLDALGKSQEERLNLLAETIRKLGADQGEQQLKFRDGLDKNMKQLREENSKKLDDMRKTVDEQLQSALEKRLTESFKTVSERLESVHKGLGEMQVLASDVGSLKRVLTNVKSRGGYGEVQLSMLIEDFLGNDQFVTNYDCGKPSGGERVEFGIKVPGMEKDVYLPVDAKFHREDYDRLLDAAEAGDTNALKKASEDLERAIIRSAKDISSKYINPPSTTEWAILFVPTEGLYAEILRRPGLFERLQREFNVTIAGPTNLQVMLSTFRMGFRQLVLQDRANDVWDVLGAVKREFEKYGDQVQSISKSLDAAQNHVAKLDTRKNVMLRALKTVETVSEQRSDQLLEE